MKVVRTEPVAAVDAASYRFPHFSSPSIIIADGRGSTHYSASAAHPDRDPPPIMVGWINGSDGVGDVYTAISHDGGRSWSVPWPLGHHDQSTRYASVTLFADEEGTFAFLGTDTSGSAAGPVNLTVWQTDDCGETWHEAKIEAQFVGAVGGRLLSYCGHYLLAVHSGDGGAVHQSALLSDDLVHWKRGGEVPGSEHARLNDGQITHTQPGEQRNGLIMVMRESADPGRVAGAGGHAWFSLSEDCGKSWSSAEPYQEVPSLDARGFFTTDSLGRYVAVFNTTPDRRLLKCRVKEPHGPWGPVSAFPSPGARNQNVDAVECAAGRYYCVLDTDQDTINFTDVEF